jgi:hypothetical protein
LRKNLSSEEKSYIKKKIENEDMDRIQQARDKIGASMLGYALLNASRTAADDFSAK